MEDKVLCPYCGSEMSLPTITDARWVIDKARLYKGNMTCTNPDCAAVSPTLYGYGFSELVERITEAALKRFKPLQKPMALEEAAGTNEFVWIETISNHFLHPCDLCYAPEGNGRLIAYLIGDVVQAYCESQYNKTWRCWATKPTEEERKAAEWQSTK